MTIYRRWSLVAATAIVVAPGLARSAPKVELLVIGNNQPPVGSSSDPALPQLRFADDDAAAFFDLMQGVAEDTHLLTVLDGDTQALYPGLAARTRPPTLAELRSALADMESRILQNRRRGDRTVVYVFFSGHGARAADTGPALAMLDGGITQRVLYEEILEKLPADYVHLFVDACHAEAVVRPRDLDAQVVPVSRSESSAFLARSTLARFPQVGAIVAAATDAQAQEWDLFREGVFTHELLSALRGAADVNHDGRIEYSEVYAFLAAANRSIRDTRARLSVVARPPELDRHVALFDVGHLPSTRTARLVGVPGHAGLVELEDRAGRRIATVRGEPGYLADLVVPSSERIYVRANGKEAPFDAGPGQVVGFDALNFQDASARPRGALEDSVQAGLFASEFGRGYYQGFIDQAPDFAPVSFASEALSPSPRGVTAVGAGAAEASPAGGWWRPSRVLVGAGISTAIADAFDTATAVRISTHSTGDRGVALSVDVAGARGTGVSEWRTALSVGWLWSAARGPVRGWLGAMAGAGLITQSASGQSDRHSGMIGAAPTAGLSLDLTKQVGLWSEVLIYGAACRRDGQAAFALLPSGFAGASVAF